MTVRNRERVNYVTVVDAVFNRPDGSSSPAVLTHTVRQKTEDIDHGGPPPRGFSGDHGGPFFSSKQEMHVKSIPLNTYRYSAITGLYTSSGFVASDSGGPLGAHILGSDASDFQLTGIGTTAIARTVPTAPAANVSTMLGEIFREGIPRAVGAASLKNRFTDYRDIGGEYLNYQFGWAPIVADLKSVAKAISDSERILGQLKRDSGKNVRRKLQFPVTTHSDYRTGGTALLYPVVENQFYYGADEAFVYENFTRKDWFSACFTFHFGLSDKQQSGLADQAKKARVLLGLDLTPEVVWNLTPWSWMADWVTNAGDVFSNVSRFARDDLAMRYGYVMSQAESIQTTGKRRPRGWINNQSFQLMAGEGSITRTYSTKKRLPATPYGFGLDTGGFTTRQWAILGALGISRGPNAR